MPPYVVPLHYRVYGLAVDSTIPIAGLEAAAPSPADCTVTVGDVVPLREAVDEDVTRDGDTFVFAYDDGTRFRIEDRGRRIVTSWQSTPEDMATYLLGPVFAFVLRLRGTLALHASAVLSREGALLFAGAAGAGKSTLAAAFVSRGATMLSDDVSAIDFRDDAAYVRAGYPRLRLWDDSAAALYGDASALPLLTSTWTKRYADARDAFAREAARVRAVVILDGRETVTRTRRLHGADAVMAILARTSVSHLVDGASRVSELADITRLVAAVPVVELRAAEDFASLPQVLAAVEAALP